MLVQNAGVQWKLIGDKLYYQCNHNIGVSKVYYRSTQDVLNQRSSYKLKDRKKSNYLARYVNLKVLSVNVCHLWVCGFYP